MSEGRSSIELVSELTEQLLKGQKREVFAYLQTLPAGRAQRLKEQLISALKQVPSMKSATANAMRPESSGRRASLSGPSPATPEGQRVAKLKKKRAEDRLKAPERSRSANFTVQRTRSSTAGSNGSAGGSGPASGSSSPSMKRGSSKRKAKAVVSGRYLLGEVLGRGNFGKVYRALDKNTGQFVAVKEIACENFGEASSAEIMLEAELLAGLSHRNIVSFLQFDQTDKHIYFVMELISSGSLYDTLEKFGSLTEQLAVIYTVQVLRGLRYLHRKGVVHGDIKADNILLTKEGKVKLVDFGTAALLNAKQESALGTPFWMAPEVINMEGAVCSSDIWSLGCTVIELVDGSPPYYDLPPMTALFKMVEEPHPPLPEDISEELEDFLLKCFVRDPAQRPLAPELMRHRWITMHTIEGQDDSSSEGEERQQVRPSSPPPRLARSNSSNNDSSNGSKVAARSPPATPPKVRHGGSSKKNKKKKKGSKGRSASPPPVVPRVALEAVRKGSAGGAGQEVEGGALKGTPEQFFEGGEIPEIPKDDAEFFRGCFHLEDINYPNGDFYRGQVDGRAKRHGKGFYRMKNGTLYRGDFANGKPHGWGEYTYPNGDVYTGGFKNDLFHGRGRYVSSTGMVHEGEYREGKRHGYGVMSAANGSVYRGHYVQDLMEGYGTYQYPSGDYYEGEFKNNKFHGRGTYCFAANGSKIEGKFENGKPVLTKK